MITIKKIRMSARRNSDGTLEICPSSPKWFAYYGGKTVKFPAKLTLAAFYNEYISSHKLTDLAKGYWVSFSMPRGEVDRWMSGKVEPEDIPDQIDRVLGK